MSEPFVPSNQGVNNMSRPPEDNWGYLKQDEIGEELSREARVWKVYVGETDKWDAQLVDGWNKSLDLILVFGALFSAISTSFLIDSSGMLRRGPNDVSETLLLAFSQTLSAIANTSSGPVVLPLPGQNNPIFVPPRNIVVVNVLWYLSLSINISTSFMAILAKEWCSSFAAKFVAHRTGHPWDQAQRRQRKWMMIEHWKMGQVIELLPSFIHLSLLLFAVGLCIYLWEINLAAAISVICVFGIAFAFYIWSSIMAIIVQYFPYKTVLSVGFRRLFTYRLPSRSSERRSSMRPTFRQILNTALYLLAALLSALARTVYPAILIAKYIGSRNRQQFSEFVDELTELQSQLHRKIHSSLHGLVDRLSLKFSGDIDPGVTTGLALRWLLLHCETPSAVDIALQAIAGASEKIPVDPLLSSQAKVEILRRMMSSGIRDDEDPKNKLYTRALQFLASEPRLDSDDPEEARDTFEVDLGHLNSENDHQFAELLESENFPPSPHNLNAIKLRSDAASHALRFLKNPGQDHNDTCQVSMESIRFLLDGHIGTKDGRLHPAALQSLLNACVLFASCSIGADSGNDLPILCMRYCLHSATTAEAGSDTGQATAIVCALLLRDPEVILDRRDFHLSRAKCVMRILMTNHIGGPSYRSMIYWIGRLEILSHLDAYALQQHEGDFKAMRIDCENSFPSLAALLSGVPLPAGSKDSIKNPNFAFLTAIRQVYRLVNLQAPSVKMLPSWVYAIVAMITCLAQSDAQRDLCKDLLSNFGFPRPSPELARIWTTKCANGSFSLLSLLTATLQNRKSNLQARQFAATQIWILLYLRNKGPAASELGKEVLLLLGKKESDIVEYMAELKRIIGDIGEGATMGIHSSQVEECLMEARSEVWPWRKANNDQTHPKGVENVLEALHDLDSFTDSVEKTREASWLDGNLFPSSPASIISRRSETDYPSYNKPGRNNTVLDAGPSRLNSKQPSLPKANRRGTAPSNCNEDLFQVQPGEGSLSPHAENSDSHQESQSDVKGRLKTQSQGENHPPCPPKMESTESEVNVARASEEIRNDIDRVPNSKNSLGNPLLGEGRGEFRDDMSHVYLDIIPASPSNLAAMSHVAEELRNDIDHVISDSWPNSQVVGASEVVAIPATPHSQRSLEHTTKPHDAHVCIDVSARTSSRETPI